MKIIICQIHVIKQVHWEMWSLRKLPCFINTCDEISHKKNRKQECIPVGCVPHGRWPHYVVSDGVLPIPCRCRHPSPGCRPPPPPLDAEPNSPPPCNPSPRRQTSFAGGNYFIFKKKISQIQSLQFAQTTINQLCTQIIGSVNSSDGVNCDSSILVSLSDKIS